MSEQSSAGGLSSLRLERRGAGIAVVVFDTPNESVNTLRASFREEFNRVFDEIDRDTSILGVVLASAKPDSFIAGADIKMLAAAKTAEDATRLSAMGHEAVSRIASCRAAVVAAIHGACLGGGLEVALAAQGRVASDASVTKLGLPEVQLGILPGMGGTQRLPRLVGLTAALDLLLTGKQLDCRRALKLGLVDEVVPQALVVQVAAQRALQLAGQREKKEQSSLSALRELLGHADFKELALAENPLGRKVVFDQARRQVKEKSHGNYPAPEAILDVVRAGLESGLQAGLLAEATAFGKLVVSPEAAALRHVYFSQQALKKDTGASPEVEPRPFAHVGVLGAGLMGAGVSYVTATAAGSRVRLKDVSAGGLQKGLATLDGLLEERVARRRLSAREKDQVLSRVTRTTDYSGFAGVDLVIEAVFEDLDLKRQVLREAEEVLRPEAIFATNTSSLPISSIAAHAKHPERVVGMHYFSPVPKMPLLEVITTTQTAPDVVRTAVLLGKKQGKTVIVVGDGPGFYTTRILGPYLNEAAFLLMEGHSVEAIDRAMVSAGFPVGPLALLDEVGIDVGAKVAQTLAAALGNRMASPPQLERLKKAGRLGRKNKKGFYDYSSASTGKGKRAVDESIYPELGLSVPKGSSGEGAAQEIAERCLLAMVNEAIHCHGEGIVKDPAHGDIGAIFGLGFPPFLGGPFHYVDAQSAKAVLGRMHALSVRLGGRFAPAPMLTTLAESGGRFHMRSRQDERG